MPSAPIEPRIVRWGRGVTISVLAAIAVAVPAILAPSNVQPAAMRLLIAAVLGLLLAPAVVAALHGKRLIPSVIMLVAPPLGLAIHGAVDARADLAWMTVATPALWGMALVISALAPACPALRGAPARTDEGRLCPACGFDRRASPVGPCPECGTLGLAATRRRRPGRRRRGPLAPARAQAILWCVAATLTGGALALVFVRWLRSLG